MLAHVGVWLLEAAFRSLLMAVAVWAGMRTMRVQGVLAQKVAWVLVLVAAGTMPLAMRVPWLTLNNALKIPVYRPRMNRPQANAPVQLAAVSTSPSAEIVSRKHLMQAVKPATAHAGTHSVTQASRPVQSSSSLKLLATPPDSTAAVTLTAPLDTTAASSIVTAAPKAASLWTWSRIKPMTIILYLAVLGFLLLRTLIGLAIAFRIWRRSEPIADLGDDMLPELGKAGLLARVSPDLATPVTIGSTILLPADYAQWDAAKLRIVLAHEHSHVRQRDFYLQLLAAMHAAVFWFSPLGWWLQRKLSELGEALSDRAGLEQAANPSTYAQVLLEFAARPRTSPIAGVAMARNSNLSARIERILNVRRFRVAYFSSRGHAVLAATLVPAALVAAVACIRIVPVVEAAQNMAAVGRSSDVVVPGQITAQSSNQAPASASPAKVPATGVTTGQVSVNAPDQLSTVDMDQEAPAAAPVPPVAPAPDVAPIQAPEPAPAAAPSADFVPVPPAPPGHPHHNRSYSYSDDDEDAIAIVRGDGGNTISINSHSAEGLEKAKRKYHNNFIWFEHGGKSYVITDSALLAQSEAMFKGDEGLNRRMAELDRMQAELNKKMEALNPEMEKARLPGPEFEAQMKKLQAQLAELQSDKYKKLLDQTSKEFSEEKLGELQEKIGDIQGQIGEIYGKIGERQGEIGERQGELGEQMGRLGEEMGRIGEQQGRNAEAAARKLRSILDQALKAGKATPVD